MAPFPIGQTVYLLGLFGDSLIANGNWALTGSHLIENLDVRIQVDNEALAGQTNANSYIVAQSSIPILAATVIPGLEQKFGFWKFYSINDDSGSTTAAKLQADFDNYVQPFVDLCHANGMIPILMTHTPSARTTLAVDPVFKSYNNLVRAKAASDVLIFDADALLSDGGTPARLISAYSLDGTHYTTAGQNVLANALGLMLRDYYLAHH